MHQVSLDYGALFDLVDMGVFVVEPETARLLDANACALAMTRCTMDELRNLPLEHFLTSEPGYSVADAVTWVRKAALEGRQKLRWQGRDHQGGIYWVDVVLQAVTTGTQTVILALCRNATHDRAQEQSLFEAEARYRAIVEAFDGLIYICSGDYQVEYMNQHFIDRTGRSAIGELCYRALHGRDTICPWCVNDRVQAGETVRWEVKSPLDNRWYYIVNTPLRHADGRISKQALIIDVTDRRQAEEQRRALEQKMRETQRFESLGHLAGGVAHDFNNLLLVMLGQMDLVLNSLPADSALRENLQEGINAAQHASGLCRQMLTYAGKNVFKPQVIDLNVHVRDVESLLRLSVSRQAELVLDLSSDSARMSGDPSQLQQVIMNLVINASESLEGRTGRIVVRTGSGRFTPDELACRWLHQPPAVGDYAWLEVSDTGIGIPEEHFPHLFDPFFSTKFTGRGLGLAAVLGIVRGHQGSIQVRSQPQQGTTIRVFFPQTRHAVIVTSPVAPSVQSQPPAATDRKTILVVDDEPMVLKLTSELIQTLGYHVLTAAGGEAALNRVRAETDRIHAILLDYSMPDLSGRETFLQIHTLAPQVPVILSSGFPEDDSIKALYAQGLSGFLPKPYLLDDLAMLLARIMAESPVS